MILASMLAMILASILDMILASMLAMILASMLAMILAGKLDMILASMLAMILASMLAMASSSRTAPVCRNSYFLPRNHLQSSNNPVQQNKIHNIKQNGGKFGINSPHTTFPKFSLS
jgi:ABC-type multidrug transport system fused ATPase/permease subunit